MRKHYSLPLLLVVSLLLVLGCESQLTGPDQSVRNPGNSVGSDAAPSELNSSSGILENSQNSGAIDDLCQAVPVDAVLVLDRSGSMGFDSDGDGDTKLQEVKSASKGFVDRLTSSDRAGLVSFDGETPVTVDQSLTSDFAAVKSAIDVLSPGGGTNVGGGVDAGHGELTTNGRSQATPVLVVLSNGHSNVGPSAVTEAQEAKDAGIRVITIAFGSGADETTLKEMASEPKDENFFTAEGSTIDDIFNTITQEICPQEVDIDIKPGSDPNSINLNGKGVISVAVFTTDEFDATTVDPATVRFGPLDEVSAGNGATVDHQGAHLEDVDNDGDRDFVGHFRTQDTGFTSGDDVGWLVGETTGGTSIAGRDAVRLLDRGGP